MGSEVAEGNIPTDTVGSNIESREMFVETVDSHILLSPVQVLNQTSNGRGERGRIQGAAVWWGNQYPGSPVWCLMS